MDELNFYGYGVFFHHVYYPMKNASRFYIIYICVRCVLFDGFGRRLNVYGEFCKANVESRVIIHFSNEYGKQ